jgi:CheY-like chemotaxis protein
VNLLNNAAKYAPPGGHIELSLGVERIVDGEDQTFALIKVRDSGMGIDREMLESVFDLFTQEDQSLARSMGGLGIGLTLTRSLVSMHGGTVTAHSDGRGTGAEFRVRLPLPQVGSLPLPTATKRLPARGPARRVLLIEDNPDALEMLQGVLEMSGHHVEVASDGVAGLDLALTTRPDVALVDIGLPGLDGYQVAERLRAESSGRGIYLVAVTGYGRNEDRERAYRAGFDAHLIKPINPEMILEMLKSDPPAQRRAMITDEARMNPPASDDTPSPS